MTYGSQITTTKTRYPFNYRSAQQHRQARKRLARQRTIKRLLHFLGFLAYWSVILSVTYLVTLALLIVCILLA